LKKQEERKKKGKERKGKEKEMDKKGKRKGQGRKKKGKSVLTSSPPFSLKYYAATSAARIVCLLSVHT